MTTIPMTTLPSRTTYHECGGTILTGGSGEQGHDYCDRCRAFRYTSDDDDDFPTGTDEAANLVAWDDGDERSPEAIAKGGCPVIPLRDAFDAGDMVQTTDGGIWTLRTIPASGDLLPAYRDDGQQALLRASPDRQTLTVAGGAQ